MFSSVAHLLLLERYNKQTCIRVWSYSEIFRAHHNPVWNTTSPQDTNRSSHRRSSPVQKSLRWTVLHIYVHFLSIKGESRESAAATEQILWITWSFCWCEAKKKKLFRAWNSYEVNNSGTAVWPINSHTEEPSFDVVTRWPTEETLCWLAGPNWWLLCNE